MAFLIGLVIAVFFFQLGTPQLWDRDEPRNSQAAAEMLARGDWIVPTFNGALREHKPVLLYWGQMLSYIGLGKSEFSARLPSALAALVSVFSVALLASRISGNPKGISQAGFWSAAVLATSLLIVMAARAATPDSCLIAASTLGVTMLVIGSIAPAAPFSSGSVSATRWRPALMGYASLGVAALAKGPVGIILPLAVVHAWWMICHRLDSTIQQTAKSKVDQSWLSFLKHTAIEGWLCFNPLNVWRSLVALRTLPGLLLSIAIAAPWYLAVHSATEGAFTRGFFIDHNVSRAMNTMEGHNGFPGFYLAAILVGTFPWSMWLIPMIVWARRIYRESIVQRQLLVLGCVWMAVYVGAFSLASTKLPSYTTPCLAGAALIIGSYFKHFEASWQMPTAIWRRSANALTVVTGLLIVIALLLVSTKAQMPAAKVTVVCGLAIVAAGSFGLIVDVLRKPQWIPSVWITCAVVFQVGLFGLGASMVSTYRQDLTTLLAVQSESDKFQWYGIGAIEPSWVYYLGGPIQQIECRDQSEAWSQAAEVLAANPNARLIVVAEQSDLFEEWVRHGASYSGPQFEAVASCPRFLKDGVITVYRASTPLDLTRMAQPSIPTQPTQTIQLR